MSAIGDVAQKLAGTGTAGGLGRAPSPGRRPLSPGMLAANSTDVNSWFLSGQCATAAVLRLAKLKGAACGESSILPAVIQSPNASISRGDDALASTQIWNSSIGGGGMAGQVWPFTTTDAPNVAPGTSEALSICHSGFCSGSLLLGLSGCRPGASGG